MSKMYIKSNYQFHIEFLQFLIVARHVYSIDVKNYHIFYEYITREKLKSTFVPSFIHIELVLIGTIWIIGTCEQVIVGKREAKENVVYFL